MKKIKAIVATLLLMTIGFNSFAASTEDSSKAKKTHHITLEVVEVTIVNGNTVFTPYCINATYTTNWWGSITSQTVTVTLGGCPGLNPFTNPTIFINSTGSAKSRDELGKAAICQYENGQNGVDTQTPCVFE